MAVEVSKRSGFSTGRPQALFRGRFRAGGHANYAVARDGRFLMIQEGEAAPMTRLHVVLDWMEEAVRSR